MYKLLHPVKINLLLHTTSIQMKKIEKKKSITKDVIQINKTINVKKNEISNILSKAKIK